MVEEIATPLATKSRLESVMEQPAVWERILGFVTTPKKEPLSTGLPHFEAGFSNLREWFYLARTSTVLRKSVLSVLELEHVKAAWQSLWHVGDRLFDPEDTKALDYIMRNFGIKSADINDEGRTNFRKLIDPSDKGVYNSSVPAFFAKIGYADEFIQEMRRKALRFNVHIGDPKYAFYAVERLMLVGGVTMAETITNLQIVLNKENPEYAFKATCLLGQLECAKVHVGERKGLPIEEAQGTTVPALLKIINMNNPEYAFKAAECLARMAGMKAEAIAALQKVVNMNDPEYAFKAADLLRRTVDEDEKIIFDSYLKVMDMGSSEYTYRAACYLKSVEEMRPEAILGFKKVIDMNDTSYSYSAEQCLETLAANASISVDELIARAQQEVEAKADRLPSAADN